MRPKQQIYYTYIFNIKDNPKTLNGAHVCEIKSYPPSKSELVKMIKLAEDSIESTVSFISITNVIPLRG